MRSVAKNSPLNVRVPVWLKIEIEKRAKKKGVNLTEYVKDVLKAEVA